MIMTEKRFKTEEESLAKYLPEVNMTDRDKGIVSKYLDDKPTYKELADLYGVISESVRQILEKFARKANHI